MRLPVLRVLLVLLGLGLLFLLIWRVGPGSVAENILLLGWGMAWIIGLAGVSHVVKSSAWQFTIPPLYRVSFSWFRMLQMRLAGEAVTQLFFAGHIFGETTKAVLLKSGMPLQHGVSSVVLDRGMYTFTSLGVMLLGGALAPMVSPLRLQGSLLAVMAGVLLVMGAMVAALRRRWPILSAPFGQLIRWRLLPARLQRHQEKLRELELLLQNFYHQNPKDFWWCLSLNAVGQALSVAEVYLILWLLGAPVAVLTAFLVEAFTKLVNLAGAIIPSNIGVYEGGNMFILPLLGGSAESGLTLGLTRRIRGLFWTAVGLLVLALFRRRGAGPDPTGESEPPGPGP